MGKNKKPIIALIYDFDGTLSPGNMQEFAFMTQIGIDKEKFWEENSRLSEKNDASSILSYMYLMIKYARNNDISIQKKSFQEMGASVKLFNGVEDWFNLINAYGKEQGVIIEHYINSSGLKEIIEGTKIAKEFKNIFASSFMYDVDGLAVWPAIALDFTTKTQFLFKINKGIDSARDNKAVNQFYPVDERPVPFSHMIYFGDGETDIPSMKLVKEQGGTSIAVYAPNKRDQQKTSTRLIQENRVNFVCPADYSQDKEIHKAVLLSINKIKAAYDYRELETNHKLTADKQQNAGSKIVSKLSL